MRTTRRSFLEMAWGAVTLLAMPIEALAGGERLGQTDPTWGGAPGHAKRRIEGLTKVTGQKIYARDFRARDLPGWPRHERLAWVVRASFADRPFERLDLSLLPADIAPIRVVSQTDLDADSIQNVFADSSPLGTDSTRPKSYMVPNGQVATYLGQPLAILIFADLASYRAARRLLRFNPAFVRYGQPAAPVPYNQPYASPLYLTRYAGRDGEDQFSQTKDGYSDPNTCPSDNPVDCEAKRWRTTIEAELAEADQRGWTLYRAHASTQVLDPMFMEPEAGLAWYDASDPANKSLSLLLGTQSPNGDIADGLTMFGKPGCPYQVKTVRLSSCYPGGGFGGRDVSLFSPLLMLAAVYADGPVRIVHDRYEQFQSGIKQLGSRIEQTLAVDQAGQFQALRTVQALQAGGKNNYSQYVAELAGFCAAGGYAIPRAIVDSTAEPSVGVVAGSMRGFGGPQAFLALEVLIDEIARARGVDAIALRQQNALQTERGDRTVTGAPLLEPMRLVEICERAQQHPLWTERASQKAARDRDRKRYGVGFALANQAYGTGSDGVMAAVSLDADGRLTVFTNAVDMGNGSATSLAISTAARLGNNAHAIEMGSTAVFTPLAQLSSKPSATVESSEPSPHHKRQVALVARQAKKAASAKSPWANPNYTASLSMSSSACITAFLQVHAVDSASLALFETGLWPAACKLWGVSPSDAKLHDAARWRDGKLELDGKPGLSLPEIAARIHADDDVAAAMVHAYFAGRWVTAEYPVTALAGYPLTPRWAIDGLALRPAASPEFVWVPRRKTTPPLAEASNYGRSLFSPSGTLAAVEVDLDTGAVELLDIHTYLDAGRIIQPQFVAGMYEGAVAMGVGYALLEQLPLTDVGAGNGRWNLDRYHVALAGDLPLERITLETLAPLGDAPTAKGIAESVLCPIPPAIVNAIAHATGHHFYELPVTPDKIRARTQESTP